MALPPHGLGFMSMHALPCDPAELARTLFEETADALFLFDPAAEQILDLNPSAQRLTGAARTDLLNSPIRALFRAEVPDDELYLQYACRARAGFLLRRQQPDAWIPVALTITHLPSQPRSVGLLQVHDLRAQRQARQQLRQKEDDLQRVLASVSDCVWSAESDAQGAWHLNYCSPVMETITGYPVASFNSDPERWFEIIHPEDRASYRQQTQRLLERAEPCILEYRIVKPDGAIRWVRDSLQPRRLESGLLRIDAVLSDITHHKNDEERYRQLWQRNLAGIVRASLDGRILDCNDSFARLFGYSSREEMFARSTTELYFDLGVREEFLDRLREQQTLTNYEMQMRRADGSAIWVLETVSLIREQGEEFLEGTLIDISERKHIEEALRASENNYRTLIDHLDQAIFLKDRELRYVTVNPNFCTGVGMSEEQLRGRTISELFPQHALTEKSHAIEQRVLREGIAIETEDVIKVAGKPRTIRISRSPVKDQDGVVVGVLGICWDVSDQRTLETQLRHVQKMDAIGQLAGGIAHDFNNLLTIMLGNLSYVLTQKYDWNASLELLRNAEKAGLRAAELTHTLLGFSHRAAQATVPLNLNQAIDEVVRMIRSTLPASVELEVRPHSQLWLVQADPGHMNQILTNLILNARDALPEGGEIIFQTSHFSPDAAYLARHVEALPGEFVRLRVRDTGRGIPAELRQRIFEPFFTTKEKGKGTGLGLAIVFGIVKQHNGWIVCDSEPSRGTSFDLYLPRCQAIEAAPETLPASLERATRETILLADDEPMIRQLAATILMRAGFQVLVAEDGAVALDLLAAHPGQIALVILDAVMPRLSGRDTLRELARRAPEVSVLFSSGYSTEQMGVNEFPQVRGFLPKPYRAEQLIQKVSEILSETRQS
jgi:PAS domain S-box-containing protein